MADAEKTGSADGGVGTRRDEIVIGTRGSALALWQAEYVKSLLEAESGLPVRLVTVKTTGDKILDVPLARVGGKGLFTKELEVELLAGRVDLCVHSMKDVPTALPEGCIIAAMTERADARDVIVSGGGYGIATLPEGATVGTSSLRRRAQIACVRPDLAIVDVRGNLDTRLRKAETGELDAVVLASAGITRLGWQDRITSYVPVSEMVPAVGQGAIGIETREDDGFVRELVARIGHAETMLCVTAERVVMRALEGGCQVPIGAHARLEDGALVMDAVVGSVDGARIVREQLRGSAEDPEALGLAMVARLRELGADAILAEIRECGEGPVAG